MIGRTYKDGCSAIKNVLFSSIFRSTNTEVLTDAGENSPPEREGVRAAIYITSALFSFSGTPLGKFSLKGFRLEFPDASRARSETLLRKGGQ